MQLDQSPGDVQSHAVSLLTFGGIKRLPDLFANSRWDAAPVVRDMDERLVFGLFEHQIDAAIDAIATCIEQPTTGRILPPPFDRSVAVNGG